MENGGGSLEDKFARLRMQDPGNISGNKNDGLFQVIKAVEAAETTIKQQVEENNQLRFELQKKILELETYKSGGLRSENCHLAKQLDGYHHQLHAHGESSRDPDNVNGILRVLSSRQNPLDPSEFSQFSSPSVSSFSPSRYQKEGEQDRWLKAPGQGLMPISELDNPNIVKQILDQEQEILQLRNHLGEYSIKEEQIRNEKYVLEKRIAYMRMAFDQQQQDLVDAASKAISYRQDIIEENIRLAYALQAAQEEKSTFVSSLLPLLAEYSLQPLEADAQSIVSNIKILFRHLQERLLSTEAKLKESQYQVAPWSSDINSNFEMSPADFAVIKDGLDVVPGVISSSDPRTGRVWDPSVRPHYDITGDATKGMAGNDFGSSPSASREAVFVGASTQFSITRDQTISKLKNEEIPTKQVTSSEISTSNATDDPDNERTNNDREPSVSWVSKGSPYVTSQEDPMSTYSSYLTPVMEEPTTSYSEAADDDPLPAIEGLQISGEAYPGRELQASGYSINGTTSCIFEWIRHMEDGSYNYIDGAQQPVYLVTADDVDTYLAIEVRPLDDRKRKGEAVKVFANEHKKITCDSDMQNYIERTLSSGHASFNVSLRTGYLDIWEPAILATKRDGFSIKCSGTNSVVVVDKFSPSITVSIPFACPGEFSITDSRGDQHLLRATNMSYSRDAIVLIMKYLILKAGEKKRKSRKRSLFFNKEDKKRW